MLVEPPAVLGLLTGVVDASPDAIVVTDDTGCIVLANARCRQVFGYETADLVGRPVEVLVPEAVREGHPRRRAGFSGSARRPMGLLQLAAVRADGREFPAEVSLAPLEVEGRRYACATVRDLSVHRREEERLRELLDAAPDATVIADSAGRIVLTNRQVESVFGYDADELRGRTVETLIPERFHGHHEQLRRGYAARPNVRGMGTGMDLFARRKDGSEFPVEVSLAPLQTDEGMLISASIRDSTERLRIENSASQMREEFLATVSHELRSPLTSIIGYLELLADLDPDQLSDQGRRMVEVIDRNARRELRIVNDLLTLAQVRDHTLELARDLVDLARVATAAVEDSRVAAERADVSVRASSGAQPCLVLGDQQRLAQVVTNLVTNAIKFSAAGDVEVTVERRGDEVQLEVVDTGVGMGPEEVERAFERHYRAPGAVDAQVPGAGLGLPIAKAIVEAHHGQVRLESERDVGTRVTVCLPAGHSSPTT